MGGGTVNAFGVDLCTLTHCLCELLSVWLRWAFLASGGLSLVAASRACSLAEVHVAVTPLFAKQGSRGHGSAALAPWSWHVGLSGSTAGGAFPDRGSILRLGTAHC